MADPRLRMVADSSLIIDDVIMTTPLSLLKTIYVLANFLILSDTLLFYTMMWIIRALWLVVAHDLSEDRYMDDVKENFFFDCFVQHGARFWKCLWDYFGLKQVKA